MNYVLSIFFFIASFHVVHAQESEEKKESPAFKMTRAEENYNYLKDKETNPFQSGFFDALKFIRLNRSGDTYLSIGGQVRPRFEQYSNRFWTAEEDLNFYSQRLTLHTSIVLGKHLRLFGEIYHGYTSHEREFAEYDELDLFQGFIEVKVPLQKSMLKFRFGRQEMGLGATRLVGIREGPNIRRSYDMGRLIYTKKETKVQVFYGKEVIPSSEIFDNDFSLFDNKASNPKLWGIYTQFPIKGLNGMNEVYYLGFQANNTSFNDVIGNETRHTLGLRRYGKIGEHWKYNTEVIYQLGEIGKNNIRAFSIDTDWHYEMNNTDWKWSPGLKLEYTSGDREKGDDKINSFNPMFVNPAFYSLAATVTPVNIVGIHPSVSFKPVKNMMLYAEWAIFWRASKNDALYRPTRFINRTSGGVVDRGIGHQFAGELQYEFSRHLSFDLDISYFVAGDFLKKSGEAENILHIVPTLSYKF